MHGVQLDFAPGRQVFSEFFWLHRPCVSLDFYPFRRRMLLQSVSDSYCARRAALCISLMLPSISWQS